LDVVITQNDLSTSSTGALFPVGSIATLDVQCTRNHITGNYIYGVNPWLWSNGWTIEHNTFGKTKAGEILGISASYGVIAIENSHGCTVAHNRFFNVHDSPFGAIWVYGHNNAILNNQINGTGPVGILIDWGSTGCYIRGNNLKYFDATDADIFLWFDTSYNTVVVGAADTIIDLGTNNVIGYEDE
jgi:hypothetical protein